MFTVLAVAAAMFMSGPRDLVTIARILPGGLFLAFLYWQVLPLLLVSTGSALEMKKLLAYPIPEHELFGLEVLLRVSTGVEVLLVLERRRHWPAAKSAGAHAWGPPLLLIFIFFNLFVSAGVRDLMARLLGRKVIRELMVFAFVIAAALPQLLLITATGRRVREISIPLPATIWPWTATAELAQGHASWSALAILMAWTAAAYFFGRWQFERGLRFDAQESAASTTAPLAKSRLEPFFRLPRVLFRDPIAALVEKELRFLSRAPRFRLVFLMGFSFGLLIWLPIAFGKVASHDSWLSRNYLALVSAYALLLLSDCLFWNVFGFDRSAA